MGRGRSSRSGSSRPNGSSPKKRRKRSPGAPRRRHGRRRSGTGGRRDAASSSSYSSSSSSSRHAKTKAPEELQNGGVPYATRPKRAPAPKKSNFSSEPPAADAGEKTGDSRPQSPAADRRRTSGSKSPADRRHSSRRHRRRRQESRRSRSRRRRRRRGGSSHSNSADRREKGGVKLFVGRLPREVTQKMIRRCFEEYGEVLEVFLIDTQASSGVGCAFVRMGSLKEGEAAVIHLHEQRVLMPEKAELGPMQVAFAKGEAARLGLDRTEETLPSYKEARKNVDKHRERRRHQEDGDRRRRHAREAIDRNIEEQKEIHHQATSAIKLEKDELVGLVKDGQRYGGLSFRNKWHFFCDQAWDGSFDLDPGKHHHEALAHFVSMANFEHGGEKWFRKHFKDLPPPSSSSRPPPPLVPPPPPFGPGPVPFGMLPPPGMMPPFPPGGLLPPPMMPPVGPPPGAASSGRADSGPGRGKNGKDSKEAVIDLDGNEVEDPKAETKTSSPKAAPASPQDLTKVNEAPSRPATFMGRASQDYGDLF